MRKTATVKVKLDEFIVEMSPTIVQSLTQLVPEFATLVIPGDFIVLKTNQIRYLKRQAALTHLLMSLFPRVYGLAGKSTVLKVPTEEAVKMFVEKYY